MMEEQEARNAEGPKPDLKWGTPGYLYAPYVSPRYVFMDFIKRFREQPRYLLRYLYVMAFGDKPCKGCWHCGRVMAMKACFHPNGLMSCQRYDTYALGRNFIQRPPLLFRLSHSKTWRKELRLAALKLSPQEPSQFEAGVTLVYPGAGYTNVPTISSQLGAINRPQVVPPGPLVPPPPAPNQAAAPLQGRKP